MGILRKEGTDQCTVKKQSNQRQKRGTNERRSEESDGIFRYGSNFTGHKKNEIREWMK
jgi:hypothetical protein